ncbi:S41 family peptidase [Pseudoxanthomonas sp. UTMC 1351]|uniref:S41 family peptidase n=1 Tax=Pseudoxanthomonas sp. UTMC 1351 TaxID=2695853 RepID=UPI0034CF8538
MSPAHKWFAALLSLRALSLCVLSLCMFASFAAHAGDTRLLRFPDICGDQVAFVQAGDLHVVAASGGVARRLTSHQGQELYPKFSPDCRRIAFSAEYDGTRQVFVMPADGGEPLQLTWYNDAGPLPPRGGTDYRVLGWTPDAQHVLVLANRTPHGNRNARPYLVPVAGGMERPLPMPESGGGMLSPDGLQYVYTPIDRDFRSWKRYRGGRAPDVWIYDLEHDAARRLTDHRASDAQPMWLHDTVYFASDRGGVVNLYRLPGGGGEPEQVTHFDTMDVLWPSAGRDAIVFERDGWLWRFDPASGEATRIPIQVPDAFRHAAATSTPVAKHVESFAVDAHGERIVFGARGEVLNLQTASGVVENLTATATVREHGVALSPSGRDIAYLSDASGEYELYVRSLADRTAKQLTRGGNVWRFTPAWSPDGRWLAFADHSRRLHIAEVATGRVLEVDRDDFADLTDHAWSPDGRWLAYTRRNAARLDQVWLYSVEDGSRYAVTEPTSSAFGPAFDPQGRWLYVLSKRDIRLTMSAYEENFVPTAATRIYAIGLTGEAPAWAEAKAAHSSRVRINQDVRIDPVGMIDRAQAIPVASGDYRTLRATSEALYFLSGSEDDAEAGALTLRMVDIGATQDATVTERVSSYALSGDGRRALVRRDDAFALIAARPQQDFSAAALDLSGLKVLLQPREEWRQSFDDSWRIVRDWFYDPDMHGGMARWRALHASYAPWAEQIAHRADLDYVLHQLVGELNASHLYVNSGDQPKFPRRDGGLLGAEIEVDPSGYFRIVRIFPSEPWHENTRSPLAGIASEGDYILAIDGVDTRKASNIYQLLQGKGGEHVRLRINAKPSEIGASDVTLRTITSEHGLRKLAWVRERRALVDRLSNGRIGYIHVPNTGASGYGALLLGIQAYGHKQALIIDNRYNGGGLVPDRMIELLARRPMKHWKRRDQPLQSTPQLTHTGPKAMLINGHSASGGDTFAHYFRQLELGPLVGTRTWGGTIAVDGNPKLADGGEVQVASARSLGLDGRWVIENEGVVPDVEAIDRPDMLAAGHDPSIEAAVSLLLETLGKSGTQQHGH